MTAVITLTTAGTDSGPFNLLSDVSVPSYSVAFEFGVTKAQLLAGFPTDNIPDGTTIVRISSAGVCTNYTDIAIPIVNYFQFSDGTNTYSCDPELQPDTHPLVFYFATLPVNPLDIVYSNVELTIPVVGGNFNYYTTFLSGINISDTGVINSIFCGSIPL